MMKFIFFILSILFVQSALAGTFVTPKRGDVLIFKYIDEFQQSCTLSYNELAVIKKDLNEYVFLRKSPDCQGWARKKDLQYAHYFYPRPSDKACKTFATPSSEDVIIISSPDGMPEENDSVDVLRKEFADSIFYYFGDSTLFIHVNTLNHDAFDRRIETIGDSLYLYYMIHPEEPIKHREFLVEKLLRKPTEMSIVRMEWDLVPELIRYSYYDDLFDSLYLVNQKQIKDSLMRYDDPKRVRIQYALMEYDLKNILKENKSEIISKMKEMRAFLDSTDIRKYDYPSSLKTRKEYVKIEGMCYIGVGSYLVYNVENDSIEKGVSLGIDVLLGYPTFVGDFVFRGSFIAYGSNGVFSDFGLMYRPNLPLGYVYSIQPEFSVGELEIDRKYSLLYYALGIRFEKSMQKIDYIIERPPGFIMGWSIGLTAFMSYFNMIALKMDIRWAFH